MLPMVVFVVLMILWLFFGCYTSWDPNKPVVLGNTIIPWLCVAILGYVVLSTSSGVPVLR